MNRWPARSRQCLFQCRSMYERTSIANQKCQFHLTSKQQAEGNERPQPGSRARNISRSQTAFREIDNLQKSSSSNEKNNRSPAHGQGRERRPRSEENFKRRDGPPIQRSTDEKGKAPRMRSASPPLKSARKPTKNFSKSRDSRKQSSTNKQDDFPIDVNNYEVLTGDYGDHFTSVEEATAYAQVLDFIDQQVNLQKHADTVESQALSESKNMSDEERNKVSEEIYQLRSQNNELLGEAMEHIVEIDEKAFPRHVPQDVDPNVSMKGELGQIPVGLNGLGNVAEDSLRFISNRQENAWEDPKKLAKKLADGRWIKFRTPTEKKEVMKLAEEMYYQEGKELGTINVGFEQPDEETKRVIVKRLASGMYKDPKDEEIQNKALANVARLCNGNVSLASGGKGEVLEAVRSLLPQERTQGQRQAR